MDTPSRAELLSLIVRLEIPKCGCPLLDEDGHILPGCEHIEQTTHNLTIAEWAELLNAVHPRVYREPPPPNRPARALSRKARVAVYEQRFADGVGLYHQRDYWRRREVRVSIKAARGANGAVHEEGIQPD